MTVTVAAAQYPVTFHRSFGDWQRHTEQWVAEGSGRGAQLLLFPEYGSMELVSLLPPGLHSDLIGQVRALDRFRNDFCDVYSMLAQRFGLIIAAPSFPVISDDRVLNRCYVFGPQGQTGYQDKLHMTRFEAEEWMVSAPPVSRYCLFEAPWGRFGLQICYDVEFPEGAAALCRSGAQLILAPSCTETVRGSTRVHVGARARALEQQCYTIVSPLVGNAGWSPAVDINYGFAAVYSTPDKFFQEEGILAVATPQEPDWLIHTLDLDLIEQVRRDGQTLNFRDQTRMEPADLLNAIAIQHLVIAG